MYKELARDSVHRYRPIKLIDKFPSVNLITTLKRHRSRVTISMFVMNKDDN